MVTAKTHFKHLKLENGTPLDEEAPFASFLFDAVNQAIWPFRAEFSVIGRRESTTVYRLIPLSPEEMVKRRVQQARAVGPLLDEVDRQVTTYLKYQRECDWARGASDEQAWGGFLIDLLMDFEHDGGQEFSITCGKRVYPSRAILAAVALRQCDRCIDAAAFGDVNAVGCYLWDIHLLLSEIALEDEREEESERASAKAIDLNRKRHARRDEDRAEVLRLWEADRNAFASAEKAGEHFAAYLSERGKDYEPRTVRDWIRSRAKEIGVKFR